MRKVGSSSRANKSEHNEKGDNIKKQGNKKIWCHICYTADHFTFDCRQKPPSGTCWACKKQGHVMKNCPEYQFFRDQSEKLCREMYLKLGNCQ